MKLSKVGKFTTASLILLSLFGGSLSANAATNTERAAERAQIRAEFRSQVDSFITTKRAIRDARRSAVTKILADYQSALATATGDDQIKAARQARKAAVSEAVANAKSRISALVKPVKPTKAPKPAKAPTA
ncbi:MAG: hypothetical protein QNL72_04665 [Candidatus Planktophila sp.]|jgi:hypothetical protein|tara:strand:- start:1285 stop:1677 length:393 start_codon:yes stop_codon:yes gene_type:complete